MPDKTTEKSDKTTEKPDNDSGRTFVFRWNVLALVAMGYLAVGVVAVSIVISAGEFTSDTIMTAFDVINAPLMALVGGSLAIAKDLI